MQTREIKAVTEMFVLLNVHISVEWPLVENSTPVH